MTRKQRIRILLVPLSLGMSAAYANENWSWPTKTTGGGEGGCLVTRTIDSEKSFAIFASANEGFGVGLVIPGKSFKEGENYAGVATFDKGPPVMLSGWALNPDTVILDSGAEEGSVQVVVGSSKMLKLTFEGTSVEVALDGSQKVIERLWECAGSR